MTTQPPTTQTSLSATERFIAMRIMFLLENNWTVAQVAEALGLTVDQVYWFIAQL